MSNQPITTKDLTKTGVEALFSRIDQADANELEAIKAEINGLKVKPGRTTGQAGRIRALELYLEGK